MSFIFWFSFIWFFVSLINLHICQSNFSPHNKNLICFVMSSSCLLWKMSHVPSRNNLTSINGDDEELRLTRHANSVCFWVLFCKHFANTSLFHISTPLPAPPQATPYILIIMSSSLTPDLWWTSLYIILLAAVVSPPHLFIYSDSLIWFYVWQISLKNNQQPSFCAVCQLSSHKKDYFTQTLS